MGTVCSPDHIDPNAAEANTSNKKRLSKGNLNESVTDGTTTEMSHSDSQTGAHDAIPPQRHSLPETSFGHVDSTASVVSIDPGLMYEIDNLRLNMSLSRDDPEDNNENTESRKTTANNNGNGNSSDIEEKVTEQQAPSKQENNLDAKPKAKAGGFQIVVTRPESLEKSTYSPIPGGVRQTDGTEPGSSEAAEEENPFSKKKKQKIDSTLGGAISWRKVADFSALLPRDVKLKLWNGVFKTETDYSQPEMKRISKVLRTFVMLQLTREYKKSNDTVPNEIKQQLAGAVKEPSKFIAGFLKKEETFIDQALLSIYNSLCAKLNNQTDDVSKKAKYAKKAKVTQDNYAELTQEDLQPDFNQHDFLKTAFLQYMLYAYQIKLDTDSSKAEK